MTSKYNYILEAFLDPEGKFYDYGTDFIQGDNVVDLNRTGVSFYDQFFDAEDRKYLQDVKNLQATVVKMTPDEYYKKCSEDIFKVPVSKLKYERGEIDRKIIDRLKTVMTRYNRRMCIPMINYADNGQEGLHRMMAIAELYGWDHEVPVLVVDWYDKQRAHEDAETAKIKRVECVIEKSVERAQQYKYTNYEEFQEQLQFTLDQEFQYSDDLNPPIHFNFVDLDDEQFEVQIGPASVTVWKEDIQLKPREVEDTPDDIDEEEIDDFLLRYFGPDWETNFPDIKTKLTTTESVEEESEYKICKQICADVRQEFVEKYGKDFLYGKCIEASDRIVSLLNDKGIRANTVEGWVTYDYEEGCTDRPYDEHTWVETANGLFCDVTATQFNSFMEEQYPEIICQYELPYNYSYEEPDNSLSESILADINKENVVKVLEECNNSYYWNTSMVMEICCEKLYYDYNIDARYKGRTIYVDSEKLAIIQVSKDGPNLVGMIGYKLLI